MSSDEEKSAKIVFPFGFWLIVVYFEKTVGPSCFKCRNRFLVSQINRITLFDRVKWLRSAGFSGKSDSQGWPASFSRRTPRIQHGRCSNYWLDFSTKNIFRQRRHIPRRWLEESPERKSFGNNFPICFSTLRYFFRTTMTMSQATRRRSLRKAKNARPKAKKSHRKGKRRRSERRMIRRRK